MTDPLTRAAKANWDMMAESYHGIAPWDQLQPYMQEGRTICMRAALLALRDLPPEVVEAGARAAREFACDDWDSLNADERAALILPFRVGWQEAIDNLTGACPALGPTCRGCPDCQGIKGWENGT